MGRFNDEGFNESRGNSTRGDKGLDELENEVDEPGVSHVGTERTVGHDKLMKRKDAQKSLEDTGVYFEAVDDFLGALGHMDQADGIIGYSTLIHSVNFDQNSGPYECEELENSGVLMNGDFSSETVRFQDEVVNTDMHKAVTRYLDGENSPENFLGYMENFLTEESTGNMLQAAYLDNLTDADADAVINASGITEEDYDSLQETVSGFSGSYEAIHEIVSKTSDILYEEAVKRKEFSQNMDLPERTPDDWYGGNQKIREHI